MTDTINVEVGEENVANITLEAVSAHESSHRAGGSDEILAGTLASFEPDVKAAVGDDFLNVTGDTLTGHLDFDTGVRLRSSTFSATSRSMVDRSGLADTNKIPLLSVSSDTGKVLVVNRTSGSSAEFYIDGVNNTVTKITDPDAVFSTTEGNAGTTNIYYDSGQYQFEVGNQTGVTADYSVHLFA